MKIFKKSLIAFFALMFLFIRPTAGYTAGISSETSVTNTFFGVTDDVCTFWKAIFDFAIQIAGGIALVVVAIGGILYLVSAGSTDKQKTAKDIMYGAGFGMVLALTSWLLFTVLNPYILECKIEVKELDICDGLNCVFSSCEDKWGVDRCFAEVVAYNESGFQPDAQLKHGNVTIGFQGLYGISWGEIQSYNKDNGTNYTKDQLLDPAVNAEVACYRFAKVYLAPKYFRGLDIEKIYGEDDRKKYLMTYLAAGSGSGALNWMIRWSKSNYETDNPSSEQLLEAQQKWGEKVIKDRYERKCLEGGIPKADCCDTYLAEEVYKTCSFFDVVTNGERYGNVLKGAKIKMINNYDKCKKGKTLYDSSKKY